MQKLGQLYIVSTPIGNLEDITLRAIRILKEVDVILCENVSEASRMLRHYEITTPTTNYFSNSKISKLEKIIDMLSDGQTLALISDAGTPGVSDPGAMLVGEVRSRAPNVKIITVPGASAVTSAYSISGLYGNNFLFLGFAPQKKGRETFFKQVANSEYNVVFYESVHRFEKCLENIKVALSNSSNKTLTGVDDNKYNNTDKTRNSNQALNRRIIIARELTKIYEEVISGNIDEVISYYNINKDKIRGEFVIMVEAKQ